MCELLGIDAFQIHHVYRVLHRNSSIGIGSDIRTVFIQEGKRKRQAAGTEQQAADETKHGKIQKSLFQNVQSSFYIKEYLKEFYHLKA